MNDADRYSFQEFVSTDNMMFREELSEDEQPPPYHTPPAEDSNGLAFEDASARDWFAPGPKDQPEMEEKGAGLVAEMTSGGGGTRAGSSEIQKDGDGAQHIEFADK